MSRANLYDQKTRKYYTDRGYEIHRLQVYSMYSKKSHDAFGWADWLAFDGEETILIQSTSHGCKAKHIRAYKADEGIRESVKKWEIEGRRAVMLSFKKVKKVRGGKAFKFVEVEESLLTLIN